MYLTFPKTSKFCTFLGKVLLYIFPDFIYGFKYPKRSSGNNWQMMCLRMAGGCGWQGDRFPSRFIPLVNVEDA